MGNNTLLQGFAAESCTSNDSDGNGGIVYDWMNGDLYVANEFTDNISIVSTASNSVIGTIGGLDNPVFPFFDPGNDTIWVPNDNSNNFTVISGSSNKPIASMRIPGDAPRGGVYDPANNDVYVYFYDVTAQNVTVYSGSTGALITGYLIPPISDCNSAGTAGDSILYDPVGDQIWFVQTEEQDSPSIWDCSDLAVITGSTNAYKSTATIVETEDPDSGFGGYTTYDPITGDIYIADFPDRETWIYSASTDKELSTISEVTGIIDYDSNNEDLYFFQPNWDEVLVYSASTGTTLETYDNLGAVYGWGGIVNVSASNDVYVDEGSENCLSEHLWCDNLLIFGPVSSDTRPPQITSFAAAPSTVAQGKTTYLNVSTYLGVAPLNYTYTGLPSPCKSQNLSSLACTPGGATGQYTVHLQVKDSKGQIATDQLTLTVSAASSPTLAASPTTVPLGNGTKFTPSVSWTNGSVSYNYTGLPAGCLTSNVTPLNCFPSVAGSYTVKVFVNDSLGFSYTATTTLAVDPAVINPMKASPSTVNQGVTSFLNVSVSWQSPAPVSYQYTGLPGGCLSKNLKSLACTPFEIGDFTVRVFANSSLGYSANTTAVLDVDAASHPVLSPNPADFQEGNSTVLTTTVTWKNGTISYDYTGLPTGCISVNVSVLDCTPNGVGDFTVRVFTNDTIGYSSNITTSIDVANTPAYLTFSPAQPDLGNSTELHASVYWKTGVLSFRYTGLPTGCSTANQSYLWCVPTEARDYSVRVFINDSLGYTTNVQETLAVQGAWLALAATPSLLQLGNSTELVASEDWQNGTVTYAYTKLPTGCVSGASAHLWCVPMLSGVYTPVVYINDSNGFSATTSVTIDVQATYLNFWASPQTFQDGNSTELRGSVVWQNGTASYWYTQLPSGCKTADTPHLWCSANKVGIYHPSLQVNNSEGFTASATLQLTVEAPFLALSASPNSLQQGNSTLITTSAPWQNGTLSYAYTGVPGCHSSNSPTLTCFPTEVGSYQLTAFVNDSTGISNSTTLSVAVAAAAWTYSISPGSVTQSETTHLNASIDWTSGTTTYTYKGLPDGCTSANVDSLACTPIRAGSYSVRVFVNSSIGFSVNMASSLSVAAAPSPVLTPSPSTFLEGNTTLITTSVSWAKGSLTYDYLALPPGCVSRDSATLACTPSSIGNFSLEVEVTDSLGFSEFANSSVDVVQSVHSVEILPGGPLSFQEGSYSVLSGFALNASGGVLSGPQVDWASSPADLGLPTPLGGNQMGFTAGTELVSGRIWANVSWQGIFRSASVNVSLVQALHSVEIAPSLALTLQSGSSRSFQAAALNLTGVPFPGPTFFWNVSEVGFGTFNSTSGSNVTFTAGSLLQPGAVEVSAIWGNVTLTVETSVTVVQALHAVHTVPASEVSLLYDASQSFTAITVNASEGSFVGPSLHWAVAPISLGNLNRTNGTVVALTAGAIELQGTLWANASWYGTNVSAAVTIFVSSTPGPAINSFAPSSASITLGQSVVISTGASGGTGSLTYNYTQLPPGCTSKSVVSLLCVPDEVGVWPLAVKVTDQAGRYETATSSLTVNPPSENDVLASIAIDPVGPLNLGLSATEGFSASADNSTGGAITGPVLIWVLSPTSLGSLNRTEGGTVTLNTGQVTESGTLNVSANWGGVTKWVVVAISVAPAGTGGSAGPTFLGLSEFDFISLIVAVAAVVVPVTVELWRRGRKEEDREIIEKATDPKAASPPPPASPPPEPPPTAPPSAPPPPPATPPPTPAPVPTPSSGDRFDLE